MSKIAFKILKNTRYSLLAIFITTLVLLTVLLLPNAASVYQVLTSSVVGWGDKLSFVFSLLGSINTNMSLFSAVSLVLTAVLFGLNITFLIYYIKQRQKSGKVYAAKLTSVTGLISGLLGVGCAACGSVILTAIVGTAGATAFLVWLPFGGLEFALLSIVLLVFSIVYILKKIDSPLVCEG